MLLLLLLYKTTLIIHFFFWGQLLLSHDISGFFFVLWIDLCLYFKIVLMFFCKEAGLSIVRIKSSFVKINTLFCFSSLALIVSSRCFLSDCKLMILFSNKVLILTLYYIWDKYRNSEFGSILIESVICIFYCH